MSFYSICLPRKDKGGFSYELQHNYVASNKQEPSSTTPIHTLNVQTDYQFETNRHLFSHYQQFQASPEDCEEKQQHLALRIIPGSSPPPSTLHPFSSEETNNTLSDSDDISFPCNFDNLTFRHSALMNTVELSTTCKKSVNSAEITQCTEFSDASPIIPLLAAESVYDEKQSTTSGNHNNNEGNGIANHDQVNTQKEPALYFETDPLSAIPLEEKSNVYSDPTNNNEDGHQNSTSYLKQLSNFIHRIDNTALCFFLLLTSTALEVTALKLGWSISWVSTAGACIQLASIRYSALIVSDDNVSGDNSQQCATTSASCRVDPSIGQIKKKQPLIKQVSAFFKGSPSSEKIWLKPNKSIEFNLELIDMSLPRAFLYILSVMLPLAMYQRSMTIIPLQYYNTALPLHENQDSSLSILPITLLSITSLASQLIRAARRPWSLESFRSSYFGRLASSSDYSTLQLSESSLRSSSSSSFSRGFSSSDSNNQPLLSNLEVQTSNMTILLGPVSLEAFAPSNTMVLFEAQKNQQLFGSEADVSSTDIGNTALLYHPLVSPYSTNFPQGGFINACLDLWQESRAHCVRLMYSLTHSKSLINVLSLTLGSIIAIFAVIEGQAVITAAALIVYALIIILLKSSIYSEPFSLIRNAHPILLEYNLLIVQLSISILFLCLSLQQVVFEIFFVQQSPSALSWWKHHSPTIFGSIIQSILLLLAGCSRLAANKYSHRLATISSNGLQKFQCAEVANAVTWFFSIEFLQSLVKWWFECSPHTSKTSGNILEKTKSKQNTGMTLTTAFQFIWNRSSVLECSTPTRNSRNIRFLTVSLFVAGLTHSILSTEEDDETISNEYTTDSKRLKEREESQKLTLEEEPLLEKTSEKFLKKRAPEKSVTISSLPFDHPGSSGEVLSESEQESGTRNVSFQESEEASSPEKQRKSPRSNYYKTYESKDEGKRFFLKPHLHDDTSINGGTFLRRLLTRTEAQRGDIIEDSKTEVVSLMEKLQQQPILLNKSTLRPPLGDGKPLAKPIQMTDLDTMEAKGPLVPSGYIVRRGERHQTVSPLKEALETQKAFRVQPVIEDCVETEEQNSLVSHETSIDLNRKKKSHHHTLKKADSLQKAKTEQNHHGSDRGGEGHLVKRNSQQYLSKCKDNTQGFRRPFLLKHANQ